jgi:hypothetical protein
MTIPQASPVWPSPSALDEWNVDEREPDPAMSREAPWLFPGAPSGTAPLSWSQLFSSTCATTETPRKPFVRSTVSPAWSPWPCVTAMMSTLRRDLIGRVFGLPLRNGST